MCLWKDDVIENGLDCLVLLCEQQCSCILEDVDYIVQFVQEGMMPFCCTVSTVPAAVSLQREMTSIQVSV